jgi:hypothetical protein
VTSQGENEIAGLHLDPNVAIVADAENVLPPAEIIADALADVVNVGAEQVGDGNAQDAANEVPEVLPEIPVNIPQVPQSRLLLLVRLFQMQHCSVEWASLISQDWLRTQFH